MKTSVALVTALFVSGLAQAGTNGSPTSEAPKSRFSFSLLPRSFQSNPKLDFNVATEMTSAGRRHTPPTADHPVYYTGYIGPATSLGATRENISCDTRDADRIGLLVARALQTRHFLPAPRNSAADLVLFIHWGAYSSPLAQDESRQLGNSKMSALMHSLSPDTNVEAHTAADTAFDAASVLDLLPFVLADRAKITALIDRARLIGGETFARELSRILQMEVALLRAGNSHDVARERASDGNAGSFYQISSPMMSLVSTSGPLATFMSRDRRTEELVEELFSSSYYIVVSAVDYRSLARNQPVLLWRTKISTNSIGVSAKETTPSMIALGAEFFGKETEGSVGVTRRVNRQGNVTIGQGEAQKYLDLPQNGQSPR